MKLLSPKTVFWAVLLAVALKTGPACLHSIYSAITPKAELEARHEDYEELVAAARTAEPEQRAENLERRRRLSLWLQARGVNVEDRGERSMWDEWSDLKEYWTLPLE
ncbi:MAG: hypothetical protein R3F13_04920 [Prosthecobacter sp.]